MSDVTGILSQIESDDPTAAEHLLPLVYDELGKLIELSIADAPRLLSPLPVHGRAQGGGE